MKKSPTKKHPGGRPSKFPKINLKQVKFLYLDGKTDAQVAKFLCIDEATLHRWKLKHSKFCESLKDWKEAADGKVEKTLYKRALGYEFTEVTTENLVVDGKELKDAVKKKQTVKEVVPDVTAQIFWLKNRKPDVWRDRIEHGGNVTHEHFLTEVIKKAGENG
jgi:hypothetical protein